MPKDIRKMLENYPEESVNLSSKHEHKFEAKLMKELHPEKSRKRPVFWLSVAASLALLVTVGVQLLYQKPPITPPTTEETNKISLGKISPELNTIETYYTNSIKLELSQLEMTDENKELVDSYLNKIGELTKEYKTLTKELNTKGVNDQTIDALISNLQLRLQLLQRLKKQLNNLKELNASKNEIV
ncbi:hypothetical protein [Pseudotenacibaculum haliotis]|uniref:Anti-sigma factor n=1 Tax=Pseudotenacibaculum haliotis TaxID=1862138 RepID=A0ABW5LUM8_9FLAO